MKTFDFSEIMNLSPTDLNSLQKTKGRVLSAVGDVVYKALLLLGFKPRDYHGICPYFEIDVGRGWGLELGWFFICSKDAKERVKNHEVGHLIQNASVGGWKMMLYCIGSALRFWYRKIFRIKTPYDSWWFEAQATELGNKYVESIINKEVS